jgi:predicted transcriptional regulator
VKGRSLGLFGVVLIACLVASGFAAARAKPNGSRTARRLATTGCQLASAGDHIKHVIYIQFDNTHFRRDNPNVPSDLEQMPHLLNFIRGNGTLLTNDHTVLISHTATGILTSLTGVYPDRMGQPVSNSFRYFTPAGTSRTGVSFAYWTAPLFDPGGAGQTDFTPEMINEKGKIAPAPWVPYTRAGCDVGSVAAANTILENTAIDIPTVFGSGSPEAAEVASNPGQAFADFVGIGVHCAQDSTLCSTGNHGRPDALPDEPDGYTGFNGLFGAKYVDPLIFPGGTPTDLNGKTIQDAAGHVGFPGFDGMEATVSLSWVAHMQEAGIPITYAYISDAHDGHGTSGNIHFAFGPGEADYVKQLQDYDLAFQQFFDRLADDGINKSNTLFVFTVDEGDHFVGDQPTPAGCNGVTVACNYNRVGEINGNLSAMIRTQFNDQTPFTVHSDDAPNVYITGNPSQTDPKTRQLEREMSQLHWTNPYTGQVENNIMVALADKTEMKTLHMVTADPARTPTFTPFADPDWFFFASGSPASCATDAACASIPARTSQSFAWNHGDIQDEIASTWIGMVGPGVKHGSDFTGWTDHTDVRPTMLSLLGLHDDYSHDGRPVAQVLDSGAIPAALQSSDALALGDMLKRIDAPFGELAMNTLKASTTALASDTNHDNRYTTLEKSIEQLTAQRDQVVDGIKALLGAAESGTAVNHAQATDLLDRAQGLLGRAQGLANH